MDPVNNISEELKYLAPALLPALGIQVYKVPDRYFEEFPLTFYPNKILNPKPAMDVPEGYFDGFAVGLLGKIKNLEAKDEGDQELKELSPLLLSANKKVPFEVPSGYLENFSGSMMRKIHPVKVVSMVARRSVFRYAAAAVVTGLLGLGIFNGLNDKVPFKTAEEKLIIAEARSILSAGNFEQTLESIPTEDIVDYLENKGQDVDAALVAVAASQGELPEPEDYLFDDQALEKFLNNLNSENLN